MLLHLGLNVITFRALLHLGPNVITLRTLLHLGQLLHLGLLQGGWGGSGVSRHLRSGKAELVTHGTCTSTSTRHVTFKSPFLLEFPYCELCDNDIKQSSYKLVNVLFRSKALFPDFSKSPKYLTTEERTATISIDFLPTCISLNVKFSIPIGKLESFSRFLGFLINHLV